MSALDLPRIEERSIVPIYYQIQEILRQKILAGYPPGQRIPSEAELQDHFKVSRATIRKAIDALVSAGVLERKRGSGTYVVEPKIDELLSHLISFTEEMELKGMRPSTRGLSVEFVEPPATVAAALRVGTDQKVLRIERLRCANDQPVVVLTVYLSPHLPVSRDDDYSGSLYRLLENKYGVEIATGDQVIEAASAREHEARLLEVRKGDPVLVIKRTEFGVDGQPLDYVKGVYRADRYSYRIQLHRSRMRR
ncbi:MAG: GntR family transcriptional regulator [Bacteroidota bacterium]